MIDYACETRNLPKSRNQPNQGSDRPSSNCERHSQHPKCLSPSLYSQSNLAWRFSEIFGVQVTVKNVASQVWEDGNDEGWLHTTGSISQVSGILVGEHLPFRRHYCQPSSTNQSHHRILLVHCRIGCSSGVCRVRTDQSQSESQYTGTLSRCISSDCWEW